LLHPYHAQPASLADALTDEAQIRDVVVRQSIERSIGLKKIFHDVKAGAVWRRRSQGPAALTTSADPVIGETVTSTPGTLALSCAIPFAIFCACVMRAFLDLRRQRCGHARQIGQRRSPVRAQVHVSRRPTLWLGVACFRKCDGERKERQQPAENAADVSTRARILSIPWWLVSTEGDGA
jgi:hypothetical protein